MVTTAAKVNLKKYLAIDGKWQFVPVLKNADGKPEPSIVLIGSAPTRGTSYIEWREQRKRAQQPVGTGAREAKDARGSGQTGAPIALSASVALARISVLCCGSSQGHL
jgi:hypothetical protein